MKLYNQSAVYFIFHKIISPRSHVVDIIKHINDSFFSCQPQHVIDTNKCSSTSNTTASWKIHKKLSTVEKTSHVPIICPKKVEKKGKELKPFESFSISEFYTFKLEGLLIHFESGHTKIYLYPN